MALSQATLIQRVRRILGEDPAVQTGSTADSSTTTITVADSTLFDVGAILEFQDNGEQVKVKSITNGTTVVAYSRGWNGTTAATHSANTTVFVSPVYTYIDIVNALERCIQSLWPYAWKRVSDTITPSSTAVWFDLAADAIDLINVYQRHGTSSERLAVYGQKDSGLAVEFRQNLPAAFMASGTALRFPNGFAHATNTIYVEYRAKLTAAVSGGNYTDLTDGLMGEAVVYGAASKVVGFKEVPLVSTQDVSQGETPIGAQARLTAAAWLEDMYRRNLNQLYDELMRTIPPMKVY